MNYEPTFLSEHWQELCGRMAQRSMTLAAYLIDAEPLFDIQNILVLRVKTRLHYDMLRQEKHRRVLEEVLATFSKQEHRTVRIIYADTPPAIVVHSMKLFEANLT